MMKGYLPMIDETHDPALESWVESAREHEQFPLQNLPLGRFHSGDGQPRTGIALGDQVIDLAALSGLELLQGDAAAAAQAALHAPLALHPAERLALRRGISELFQTRSPTADRARRHGRALLHAAADCTMLLPARIGNFSDFNAGINHSRNGRSLRGDAGGALPRNFHHIPIAYHARASSITVSGTPVRRPCGQTLPEGHTTPMFGPTRKLDIELELGIWIGRANVLGEPISIGQAAEHIAGYCLLNDWSSRDVMGWEMDRLGPFLGKSFATTISTWVVSPEALAPFRAAAFARTPDLQPLPYLLSEEDQRAGALSLELEAWMRTQGQRQRHEAATRIVHSHATHLYWTPAQMLTHHASNGCNLEVGDLIGTGTISAPELEGFASLRERGQNGAAPFAVGNESRCWAEDGDEVTLRAHGVREGFRRIGFGDCSATVLPARMG